MNECLQHEAVLGNESTAVILNGSLLAQGASRNQQLQRGGGAGGGHGGAGAVEAEHGAHPPDPRACEAHWAPAVRG